MLLIQQFYLTVNNYCLYFLWQHDVIDYFLQSTRYQP